jgi:hypothetical protein
MRVTRAKVTEMNIPLGAANSHTTEHLLELALVMLDDARREQNNVQLPINNWLTNNFTLELIRAKVAVNKANGAESRSPSAALSQRACGSTVGDAASHRSISAEALAAIEATLPEGREADRRPDGKAAISSRYRITCSIG